MIISFVLLDIATSIWLIYLFAEWNHIILPQVFLSLLIGVAFFNILASFANIIWCGMKVRDQTKTPSIVGLVLSIIAILLFITYVVVRFVARADGVGLDVF